MSVLMEVTVFPRIWFQIFILDASAKCGECSKVETPMKLALNETDLSTEFEDTREVR